METIVADVRDLRLPDSSIDVVFINACYPNIVDKAGAFSKISRMMKAEGRMVISHPLGKAFILSLIDALLSLLMSSRKSRKPMLAKALWV